MVVGVAVEGRRAGQSGVCHPEKNVKYRREGVNTVVIGIYRTPPGRTLKARLLGNKKVVGVEKYGVGKFKFSSIAAPRETAPF